MIGWAWRKSACLAGNWRLRIRFVEAALREPAVTRQLQQADPETPIGRLLKEWPDTVGYLLWPYQCAAWHAETRLTRIEGHLQVLEGIPGLKLAPDEKLVLADLGSIAPGLSLVIDRPKWLSREGHLTLSLFKE